MINRQSITTLFHEIAVAEVFFVCFFKKVFVACKYFRLTKQIAEMFEMCLPFFRNSV